MASPQFPSKFPELFSALAAPFAEKQVRERKGAGGAMLKYITARTAMNRFDEVLGQENWWPEYFETKDGIKCRITVRLPDGSLLAKEDGGGFANMPEEDNTEKSGYSDAFKRAAVVFGVARYLYKDGLADWISDLLHGRVKVGGTTPEPAAPGVSPRGDTQAADDRPFPEFLAAAAKAAGVAESVIMNDVLADLTEQGKTGAELRDDAQRRQAVAEWYRRDRAAIQATVKALVKHYRAAVSA